MTIAPIPHQPSNKSSAKNIAKQEATPVFALKEMVASLHREQNKIQDLLSSLGFALRSFNNLNQFLELTPLMAARVTDADGGLLLLFKPNGQVRLEQLYCQHPQLSKDIRLAFELAIRHSKREENLFLANQGEILSFWLSIEEKVRQDLDKKLQLFSTPILVKNIERGRLYIFCKDSEYSWTVTRRKLAQLVADQTAVAIANNELTLELRSKERQDRELEIASEIQLRLLPNKCPKIQGVDIAAYCQTANRVGGDYYDFIPTNYDRLRQNCQGNEEVTSVVPWSIVIGDVMGKGVPAGLIMTMTRGMLRAEVLNRHSPAKILEHLNRVMYVDLENSHRFVTLFYSEYNPETKILSFSNAAHHPPLCWRAKTNTIEHLDTVGMLIGLDPDSQYEDDLVHLESGDTIMYYTDGFTDAISQQGDRFDEDNLVSAFQWACNRYSTSQAILDCLFAKVQSFAGADSKQADDMTLVIVRIKS